MNRLPFLVIRNYSNLQLFQSTEIANTAYNTKGYNLPPKNARWLVIIMCRARSSPLQITAGRFCSFTFALYCQVSVKELLLCTIFSEMKIIFDLLTGLLHVFLCHMMRFVETMGLKSCMSLSFLERYCEYKQTIYAIILVIGNCKTFPWLFFPKT